MIEFSRKRMAGLPLQIAMLLCFSLMAIYWVRIAQFGGFSLEAFHIGLLCIITVTCASIYSPASIFRVLVYCAPWFLAYLAYLLFLVPAVAGTSGTVVLFKQALFVTGFLCIAAYFSRAPEPAKTLRRGALCGIVLYIAFTEYSAQLIGKSLLGATIDFLGSGSFKALIYGFFRPVFNSLEDGTELTFVASLTNSIAVSLLVLSVCFRIGYSKRGLDAAGSLVTILTLSLCLLLNARSVVLAALASIFIAFIIRLIAARAVSLTEMLYWCLAITALVGAAFVAIAFSTSAVDSIIDVFQFRDSSAESRLEQYEWAFGLIEEQLLVGHGYVETDSGYPIHNLFLSSWAYIGFAGFVLVVVFYIGLVVAWLRWLYFAVTKRSYWTLGVRLEWVAVLPVLPLFRVWISGAGGLPAYGEWIALGVFFGLVMRNESELLSRTKDPNTHSISGQPKIYSGSGRSSPAMLERRFSGRGCRRRVVRQ